MSILIKDMEMPERCLECPLYDNYNYYCTLYSFGIPARYNRDGSTRPEWCEIKELPKCEDAVSRQAAINTMYELMGHWFGADSEDEKREIKREFDKLASVQPEQRWIPVTERLPEDEYVLISKKPSKITGSKWSVDIAIRTADPRSGKIQWRDSGFGVIQDDKVLAWMPRPKPYREEGEAEWQ